MVFEESFSEEVTFERNLRKKQAKAAHRSPGARPPSPTQEEQGRDSQGCFLYILWPHNEYMYGEGHLSPALSFSLGSSFAVLFINCLFHCHISFLLGEEHCTRSQKPRHSPDLISSYPHRTATPSIVSWALGKTPEATLC